MSQAPSFGKERNISCMRDDKQSKRNKKDMRRTIITSLAALLTLTISAGAIFEKDRTVWAQKAQQLTPTLVTTERKPVAIVKAVKDTTAFQHWRMDSIALAESLYGHSFKGKRSVTFDFGEHLTGHFTLRMKILTKTQDAPIRLRLTFGELPAEINMPLDPWHGKLSRAWMQDETVTVEDVTQPLTISRRLAMRYVRIDLLAQSSFDFAITDISFTVASSAGDVQTKLSSTASPLIRQINDVATRTLHECMQTVYEDGPKRDHRLWIGDLYLESLANRYTFRQFQLTKHCLYLLASLSDDKGLLMGNCFEKPTPHPEYNVFVPPYSLLYDSTLLEYLKDTDDQETAKDLYTVAQVQMDNALTYVGEDNLFDPARCRGWIFFDHLRGLDTSAPMQRAICFALSQSAEFATMLGHDDDSKRWTAKAKEMRRAGHNKLFDKKRSIVVSGKAQQVSIHSQAWAIKGGILSSNEGQRAISTALVMDDCVKPSSPYATHYRVDAMHLCGMHKEARQYVEQYWGGMVNKGADTFWEAYAPDNDFFTPYNFFPLNNSCHAWSCTPVCFIHQYPKIYQQ